MIVMDEIHKKSHLPVALYNNGLVKRYSLNPTVKLNTRCLPSSFSELLVPDWSFASPKP